MKQVGSFYDYSGVIHIHTIASDGGQDLFDIIRVADELGVDFLVLGDHNTIDPRFSSFASNVLVVPGIEYSPGYQVIHDTDGLPVGYDSGSNHLLGIGISDPKTEDFDNPQANIDTVNTNGGLSILAHPADFWLPWNAWHVEHFTGIEIWTYLSDWAESVMNREESMETDYGDPDAALAGPKEQVLQLWDVEGRKRRILGIGSMDTHSKIQIVQGEPLMVFPLKKELNSIRTHVVLPHPLDDDQPQAVDQILNALRDGRCYIALDSLADSSGFQFRFWVDDRFYEMGEELDLTAKPSEGVFQIFLSHQAQVCLLLDGVVIHQADGREFRIPTKLLPGVYRVEVKVQGRMWILSNPIYLRG